MNNFNLFQFATLKIIPKHIREIIYNYYPKKYLILIHDEVCPGLLGVKHFIVINNNKINAINNFIQNNKKIYDIFGTKNLKKINKIIDDNYAFNIRQIE